MDISLNEWEQSGEGATAITYNHKTDKSILLKVFKKAAPKSFAENEYNNTKAVMSLGVNIPKVYELVTVNGSYGVIYERILDKKSIANLCNDDITKIKYYASYFAEETKKLHNLTCTNKNIVSAHDRLINNINKWNGLNDKEKETLISWAEELEETNTCLHGDLNPGNMIIADNKTYWIDIGGFAYGNQMYDLGTIQLMMCTPPTESISQKSFHMSKSHCKEFWLEFSKVYFGDINTEKLEEFRNRCTKYRYLYYDLFTKKEKFNFLFQFVANIIAKKVLKEFNYMKRGL